MLIDTHAHIEKKDAIKTIEEAKDREVNKIILAGTDLNMSDLNVKLSEKYPELYATIGIYPHDETDKSVTQLEQSLKDLVAKNSTATSIKSSAKIVGVGECGLDYKETLRSKEDQKDLFLMQLKFAKERNFPVVIHSRNSYSDLLHILETFIKKNGKISGVIHCFVGTEKEAGKFLALGFLLSFNGILTYNSGKYLEKIVAKTPLTKILVETDSPFLVPEPLRSDGIKINTSKNVKIVAEKIAEVKNISYETVCNQTTENAKKLFGI